MLKSLTNFSIEGACPDKPSGQHLYKNYSRLPLEELKRNCWSSPSSSSWQLDKTTRSNCATTLTSFVGKLNQKHISTMTNTFNASQSATVANQFQAWQARMERKQEENEHQMQSLLQQVEQLKRENQELRAQMAKEHHSQSHHTFPQPANPDRSCSQTTCLSQRHVESSHQMHKEDFSSSHFRTWPKQPYALTDQSHPDEAASSSRGKRKKRDNNRAPAYQTL